MMFLTCNKRVFDINEYLICCEQAESDFADTNAIIWFKPMHHYADWRQTQGGIKFYPRTRFSE